MYEPQRHLALAIGGPVGSILAALMLLMLCSASSRGKGGIPMAYCTSDTFPLMNVTFKSL
jgi:hypothetical protein